MFFRLFVALDTSFFVYFEFLDKMLISIYYFARMQSPIKRRSGEQLKTGAAIGAARSIITRCLYLRHRCIDSRFSIYDTPFTIGFMAGRRDFALVAPQSRNFHQPAPTISTTDASIHVRYFEYIYLACNSAFSDEFVDSLRWSLSVILTWCLGNAAYSSKYCDWNLRKRFLIKSLVRNYETP